MYFGQGQNTETLSDASGVQMTEEAFMKTR